MKCKTKKLTNVYFIEIIDEYSIMILTVICARSNSSTCSYHVFSTVFNRNCLHDKEFLTISAYVCIFSFFNFSFFEFIELRLLFSLLFNRQVKIVFSFATFKHNYYEIFLTQHVSSTALKTLKILPSQLSDIFIWYETEVDAFVKKRFFLKGESNDTSNKSVIMYILRQLSNDVLVMCILDTFTSFSHCYASMY